MFRGMLLVDSFTHNLNIYNTGTVLFGPVVLEILP